MIIVRHHKRNGRRGVILRVGCTVAVLFEALVTLHALGEGARCRRLAQWVVARSGQRG